MSDNLAALEKQSVQSLPDAGAGNLLLGDISYIQRGPLLPPWGTRERELWLRKYYHHDFNWAAQGAFAGILNLIATTPWEISGPDKLSSAADKFWKQAHKAAGFGDSSGERSDIEYWQAFLRQADFGRGWDSFVKKGIDYLRQDGGWFWEIIAPGNPMKAPTGPATGLAHLDSLRCYPTGDPEFPVIYYNRLGKYHLLHRSRVVQLVDMPDGDEARPGYGKCALSRAIAIVARQMRIGKYVDASLDELPMAGFAVASNLSESTRDKAREHYRREQAADEKPEWGRLLWLYSMDPQYPIELDIKSFMQAPDKFDLRVYTDLDIDALALAIGVDRQDLWQLTGGNIGSSTQSKVLADKSRGKTIGNLRGQITRFINDILPEDYEFAFKYRDAQEDAERANTASAWASVITALGSDMSIEERRQMAANTIEAVKNAITDEHGQIRRVDDEDVSPAQTLVDDAAADGAPTAGDGDQDDPDAAAAADGRDREQIRARSRMDGDVGGQPAHLAEKVIQATRIDFEDAFADAITARQKGEMTAARFGIVARGLLRRYGLQALRDGLEDGGVQTVDSEGNPLPLEPDEQAVYDDWLIDQSVFVSNFGKSLSVGEPVDPAARAVMWGNKSLMLMYDEGIASANGNAMMEFAGDDGDESCKTCQRLKGQRHRMKDWKRRRLRPQVDTENFKCGGWRCKHVLVRTTERAKGRF